MKFVRIGNIVSVAKGKKPTFSESPDENSFRVLQIDDLRNDNNIKYTDDKTGVFAKEEDVLIAWDGANAGTIGFGKTGFIGSTIAVLRKNNSKDFDTVFIGKFLQTQFDFLRSKSTGATIPHINRNSLENLRIPLISLSDQIQTANILSKAENLISQRKESIALLDEFLKSTFLEMFGDTSTNKLKWDKVELKKFGKIITGNTPPRNNDDNYSSDFIEWIKTDNISSDKTYITTAVEYLSESGLKGARTVENGALLIACIAGSIESVGRAAIANRTVSFNQQINAIQPNKDIEPLFLYWLFKISKKYVQNHATKGMKKILTKGEFEKILMIKPPLSLQTKFAQIVEKTEALKTHYQSSLQELENLYGSLSQRAFKGELTLNHAEEQVLMAAEPEVEYQANVII